jgi:hypothetical protein
MSRTFALMALMLALATAPALAYEWAQLDDFDNQGANSGSALCAGVTTEANSETYNAVWMIHGGSAVFERYDIALDSWAKKAYFPYTTNRPYVHPRGALCFVPNPNASPLNGWVFGIPGSPNTTYPCYEFWVYFPDFGTPGAGDTGKWVQCADIPEDDDGETEGAALCYGGTTTVHGMTHAVIYAFTGQEYQDEEYTSHVYFWRYTFEFAAPADGTWEQLESIAGENVNMGGALAWVPHVDANHNDQWVVATTNGSTDDCLWRYDPTAQYNKWTGVNPVFDDNEGPGCCLAGLQSGSGVMMLYGGGSRYYSIVVPAEGSSPGSIETDYNPPDGEDYVEAKAGSAVAELDGVFYAEFGDENGLEFWGLYPTGRGGGQGTGGAGCPAPRVAVHTTRGSSNFTVCCRPGPVSLKIVNSAGTVVSTVKAEARSGLAELTWPHGPSASGAYLYIVSTSSGVSTGKLTVVR